MCCHRRCVTVGVLLCAIQLSATARDTYVPEPVPPSAAVRDAFDLDPFYRQWIDVEGVPVLASARVNPFAVKEAAWLIRKMIGHRRDVLQALARNGVRFAVMAHDELTTQIPEHADLIPDFYWDRRARGLGPTAIRPATSCGEENLLNYPGDPYSTENILIHEFSHAIHQMGLNTVDPSFEDRLREAFNSASGKGLWTNTYAATNKEEYWAEGAQSWFDTNRERDHEHNHVNTRAELKAYDPALATLLAEVFGDTNWRYTAASSRTNLAHLQGFNPRQSPRFEWSPELIELASLRRELGNPDSDGDGKWTDLQGYDADSIPKLRSRRSHSEAAIIFVNRTRSGISYHWIDETGEEHRYGSVDPDDFVTQSTFDGHVWLVKDAAGRNLSAFRAAGKTGRALVISASDDDDPIALQQHTPGLLSNLRSIGSKSETAIVLVNRTQSDIFFFWVDFDGKETYYGRVVANAEFTQHTYAGHVWVVKDGNGSTLALFRAEETPGRAVVTTQRQSSG